MAGRAPKGVVGDGDGERGRVRRRPLGEARRRRRDGDVELPAALELRGARDLVGGTAPPLAAAATTYWPITTTRP